jgi:tripeptide aminopeptidase
VTEAETGSSGPAPSPDTIDLAGTAERRALTSSFVELCRIESPSGRERALAEHVTSRLRALGLDVEEDGAAAAAGSDCGNLLTRIASRAAAAPAAPRPTVLLCAHLDTVPLTAPVEPVVVDGFFENANEGILGADNKAAVAVLLAVARHARTEGVPVDLELLFTVGEEVALAGARAFDTARLRSDFGFVFDHASPIGEVIVASPTHFRIDAAFRGQAAHAGIRPQDGRSAILAAARAVAAMPHGRLDESTTVNVGTIEGGTALNVVPDRCVLKAEVRSHDDARAEEVVAEIVDRCHDAANAPDSDCDLDLEVQRTFTGYRLGGTVPALAVAEGALRSCGYEPDRVQSGGGSDANALIADGLTVVNVANGTERNHEPDERVGVHALEEMLSVTLALLDQAAALPAGAGR